MSGDEGDENDVRGVRIRVSVKESDEREVEAELDRKARGVRGDEGDGVDDWDGGRFLIMDRPSNGRRSRMETGVGVGPSGEG
jgi:hypothetical protein